MTPNKNFKCILPIPRFKIAESSFNVFLFPNVQLYMSFYSDVKSQLH